ncbi:MAG: phosphoribosylanthranilate isomerase [Proteobacteria bacterium]|nr:phosphoribosylanthranilate isomerase [Pseudomonadota bacterium]
MATAVKICGITRRADAQEAARLGAHALGFVFYDKSPRNIANERAAEIVKAVPPFVTTVGLFVNPAVREVENVLKEVPLNLLQFHGEEPADFCAQFGVPYIKAVRVKAGLDLLQYAQIYGAARGLLLDAFVDGTHGGTGTAFDWNLIPRGLPLQVILSGGLNPANVAAAIRRVAPWAVDVSSGVEASPGIKDPQKIAAFMKEVRSADV